MQALLILAGLLAFVADQKTVYLSDLDLSKVSQGWGEPGKDKTAAYQTLFECLVAITKMTAPIAPFLADELYRALMSIRPLIGIVQAFDTPGYVRCAFISSTS